MGTLQFIYYLAGVFFVCASIDKLIVITMCMCVNREIDVCEVLSMFGLLMGGLILI